MQVKSPVAVDATDIGTPGTDDSSLLLYKGVYGINKHLHPKGRQP